jgi:hypothetical protein
LGTESFDITISGTLVCTFYPFVSQIRDALIYCGAEAKHDTICAIDVIAAVREVEATSAG